MAETAGHHIGQLVPHPGGTRARRAPTIPGQMRTALGVGFIGIVLASLFATSLVVAVGRPRPRAIRIAAVGGRDARPGVFGALAKAGGIEITNYATEPEAVRAIGNQRVYGAVILGERAPRLLVSSASSGPVAHALEALAQRVAARSSVRFAVTDLHPLPAGDPQGLVLLYALIAAMLLGFVTTFLIQVNAPELTLAQSLGCIAGLAVIGSLAVTLIVGPILGGLPGSFLALWAALAGWVAICSLLARTMLAAVGRFAVVPTVTIIVILGIPSSGAAVGRPLLPTFYRAIGGWLPDGATADVARTIAYFPDHPHLGPIAIQGLWLVGCLAALIVVRTVRRRRTVRVDRFRKHRAIGA